MDVKKFLLMRGSSVRSECRTHNPDVAGSNPAPATNEPLLQTRGIFPSPEPCPAIELLMQLVNRQAMDSELWFTSDVKYVRPQFRELTRLVELAIDEFELEHKANEMLVIERDDGIVRIAELLAELE